MSSASQIKVLLDDLEDALRAWKGQPDVWERVENWLYNARRISDHDRQTQKA